MKISNIDQWICETEQISDITREKLNELQFLRLNELLHRYREKGSIGQNLPHSIASLEELQMLPFTTAQMISEHPGRYLLTSQSEVSRVISDHPGRRLTDSQSKVPHVISESTSGTTGPAKRVFYTERDTAHTVSFFAAGIGEMVNPGERVLIAFPFSGPFGLGDLIEQAVLHLGAESIRAGHIRTYGELCRLIYETQPDCYIGFPTVLLSAARFYPFCFSPADSSCPASALKYILSDHFDDSIINTKSETAFKSVSDSIRNAAAESVSDPPGYTAFDPVFPIRRALISGDACPSGVIHELERHFSIRLFPHYGSRESGLSGAITCPAHEGMHLKENHMLAEIIDENQNPVPDGTWGELVITTFGLEAMPLLRYRTGDRARLLSSPCPCGSITKRLDTVSRITDGLLSMEELDSLLFTIPDLIDFRAKLHKGILEITVYSITGTSSVPVRKLLQNYLFQKQSPTKPLCSVSSVEQNTVGIPEHMKFPVSVKEKKCLPEDSFLHTGKRILYD